MRGEVTYENVEVYIHKETEKAVLVSLDEDKDSAVWVPKSQIENRSSIEEESWMMLSIATWIAEREGLM